MAKLESRSFVGRDSSLPDDFACDGNAHDVLHAMQKKMTPSARRVMLTDVGELARGVDLAETYVKEAIRDLMHVGCVSEMNPPVGWYVDTGCTCEYAGHATKAEPALASARQEGLPSHRGREARQAIAAEAPSLEASKFGDGGSASPNRIEALYDELLPGIVDTPNRIETQRKLLLRLFIELAKDNRSTYVWKATNKVIRGELSPNVRRWINDGVPPRQIGDMVKRFWTDVADGRVTIATQPQRAFINYRADYGHATSETAKPTPWSPT